MGPGYYFLSHYATDLLLLSLHAYKKTINLLVFLNIHNKINIVFVINSCYDFTGAVYVSGSLYRNLMNFHLLLLLDMAGEVVVDALPYFDQGYDEPGVRDAVC